MTKAIFLIFLSICLLVSNAAYSENTSSNYSTQNNDDIATANDVRKKPSGSNFWHKVWGENGKRCNSPGYV
ncbi:MAG: hypothetical protein KJP23_16755, partial [Deltaproteobacteria bacterium]|nr:hypothetical protein [Deltaproteobacteria bacterium]